MGRKNRRSQHIEDDSSIELRRQLDEVNSMYKSKVEESKEMMVRMKSLESQLAELSNLTVKDFPDGSSIRPLSTQIVTTKPNTVVPPGMQHSTPTGITDVFNRFGGPISTCATTNCAAAVHSTASSVPQSGPVSSGVTFQPMASGGTFYGQPTYTMGPAYSYGVPPMSTQPCQTTWTSFNPYAFGQSYQQTLPVVQPQSYINFRDVEDSLTPFAGEEDYLVEKFVSDFEEAAKIFGWNDMQQVIYGKRLCKGVVKEALKTTTVNSWAELKSFLVSQFYFQLDSALVHKQMVERKKMKDESCQSYLITMIKLGTAGKLEEKAIIRHTIDGIQDSPCNKAILMGAVSLGDFRAKLKLYEELKQMERPKPRDSLPVNETRFKGQRRDNPKPGPRSASKCYGCGSESHQVKNCDKRKESIKCFKCGETGQISRNCPKIDEARVGTVAANQTGNFGERTMKLVKIEGKEVEAMVDCGSVMTIVSDRLYAELGSPVLNGKEVKCWGIGNVVLDSLGCFEAVIEIDGEDYIVDTYILREEDIPSSLMLGKDVMNQSIVVMTKESVTMMKVCSVGSSENDPGFHLEKNEFRDSIQDLIRSYAPKKPKESPVVMKILLRDEEPVHQNPRRLSVAENEVVKTQVAQWMADGIVKPSRSDYASPVVLVPKKDGTKRLCIDYRQLNRKVIKDRYPLPLIEDQLDRLQGAKVFSTLDLENGFFHVPIHEDSQKYTAFVTPFGQFEFCFAPFGLCTSPAVFQRYVNHVFRPLINNGVVLVYMDDIVVLAGSVESGIERLHDVLALAARNGLRIKWKKCQFLCSKINYLGYEIENGGHKPSIDKTLAVSRFPEPKSVKNVQEFLGLTGFFRKFVPNYSLLAKGLTDLTKKDVVFNFGFRQKESFECLKKALISRPVLALYDPKSETELHTDACKYGYGATLLQRGDDGQFHPVYFYSKKTKAAEENYNSHELEALAIVNALKKLRVYLIGIKFKIVTDCSAFKMTMTKKELVPRIARWALMLEDFDYDIEHRSGTRMRHADALSRNAIVCALDGTVHARMKAAQNCDGEIRAILEVLKSGPYENFVAERGVLYADVNGERKIVVPKNMQGQVIRDCHDQGHFGVRKTKELIEREFWFANMKTRIEHVIASCVPCIMANRKAGKLEGYLNPIPKGDTPLDTYHVDHVGRMTATGKQYQYILVVVDAFSKFVWLYPTRGTGVDEVIKKLDLQQAIFGNPRRIVSDRGSAFTSTNFTDYCQSNSIEHVLITTGVPRGNGQVENMNRSVINCLAKQLIADCLVKLSADKPDSWWKYTNRVQRFFNNSYHRSTKKSPFELMFGVKMRTAEDKDLAAVLEAELIERFEGDRSVLREEARQNISKIQAENRKTYNKKRKLATKYHVGDLVAIKRTQFGSGLKIARKYLGPYEVLKVNSPDRYDVKKVGAGEGPNTTSTSVDNMKPFVHYDDSEDSEAETEDDYGAKDGSFEANEVQDGRM